MRSCPFLVIRRARCACLRFCTTLYNDERSRSYRRSHPFSRSNDVVAPSDSTKDRTLDQQCTVTRPGLAPMAAASAVELMVGVLHHPLRHRASADPALPPLQPWRAGPGASPLGALPHQMRFFLPTFGMVQPVAHAFEHCTACNARVVEAFRARGFGLVRAACGDAGELGRVSGLEAFQADCDALVATTDFDLEDSDDDL